MRDIMGQKDGAAPLAQGVPIGLMGCARAFPILSKQVTLKLNFVDRHISV